MAQLATLYARAQNGLAADLVTVEVHLAPGLPVMNIVGLPGQKLADGSYRLTGATSVEITGTSLIRQTGISFNCLLVSTSQLNCTSATGQNFVLTRRG